MVRLFSKLDSLIHWVVPQRFAKVARYIFAGGTAAAVDIILLYVFTSLLHIWYLISAILAFLVAFVVSFTLQKFWTFGDHSTDQLKSQAALYLVITATNLGLNTLLIFLFVEYAHLHYLIAQIITSALLACESFFVYQIFVFKKQKSVENVEKNSGVDSHNF